ncbi:MAG TPA: hypothetical protein VNG71_06690 [Pyrinomonadaceae bacterium]|nr:hypothetical protein [Pyrinomonadaceae bacterium]
MQEDQAIAEIREVRRRISEECDHDPRKLITYYKELQLWHKERLLRPEDGKEEVGDDLVKA